MQQIFSSFCDEYDAALFCQNLSNGRFSRHCGSFEVMGGQSECMILWIYLLTVGS